MQFVNGNSLLTHDEFYVFLSQERKIIQQFAELLMEKTTHQFKEPDGEVFFKIAKKKLENYKGDELRVSEQEFMSFKEFILARKGKVHYVMENELKGWDIILSSEFTPNEFRLVGKNELSSWVIHPTIITHYVEYKSSVDEWQKRINEFIRQIQRRKFGFKSSIFEFKFLVSFDQRFETYRNLLSMNNIELIILPQSFFHEAKINE